MAPKEDPNTLRSRATGRLLFVVGEGNNVGLAEGEQSILLNGTPLTNKQGVRNFPGVTWHMRTGTPDQEYIPDFPAVESEQAAGLPARVKSGNENAIVRRVDNLEANSVRVSVGVPSIFKQDMTTGDTHGSRVDFMIRISGLTVTKEWTFAIDGKQMGPYAESIHLPLEGVGPWDITVIRGNPESETSNEQNTLEFQSWTEIVDRKLTYSRSALMGLIFDAQYYGNQLPQVAFDWMGMIVQVPDNYDAVGRVYQSPFWSGNWKLSWTDDPVWLWRHIALHFAGAKLHESQIDHWALYSISRYASERVPDGYGGMEPRFSANFCLNTREEAYAVLNALASCLRAMTYWSSGAVTMVADMPTDPDVIVVPGNTIGGFEYSGASLNARHTVALVSYLDKDNSYEPSVESVEDPEGIDKYGWNPTEITAFACTSRGQAHRLGKWLLDTEIHETEGLNYKASIDHMDVAPGMVAAVADPNYQGIRSGGRIKGALVTQVDLDEDFELLAGETYALMCVLPNGEVEERTITNAPGVWGTMMVTPAFSIAPQPEAIWAITSSNLEPRQFRILGVSRDNDVEFSVSALFHDPLKFARVEQGIIFEEPPYTLLPDTGVTAPPSDVEVSREYVSTPSGFIEALQVRWTRSPDAFVRGYVVMFQKDYGAWTTRPETTATNDTLYGSGPGFYRFYVYALNFAGVQSLPAVLEVNILNESPITLLKPTGLELEGQGNNTVFNGRDPKFVWRATALRGAYPMGQEPAAGAGYLDHIFRDFEIRIFDITNRLIFVDHTVELWYKFDFAKNVQTDGGPHRAFKFVVLMRDIFGNFSRAAELEVANPAPAAPRGLSVLGGYASIFVSFERPTDLDYQASLIYVSPTSGVEPGPATLAYDGPDTFKYLPSETNVELFVIVASYDSFGKSQLNYSGEIRVLTSGVEPPDMMPPAVPVGVTASSYAVTAPDGTTTYRMLVEWDANTEDDLLNYTVAIRQEGGGPVPFPANEPKVEIVVDAGETYFIAVRAGDHNSNWSPYSPEIEHLVAGDDIAPLTPTGLGTTNTFRSVWLKWDEHPDSDFKHMEIWEAKSADRNAAVLIGRAPGNTFVREDIPTGETRWFWIRAVDRSKNVSDWHPSSVTGGITGRPRPTEEADYQELSITNAVIANGAIDTAKVSELEAKVLKAGSTMSASILVDGQYSLGELAEATGDPAARINKGSTKILPGLVELQGGTSLVSWAWGADLTRINGGQLATSSVRANALTIGNRNLDFLGMAFEMNKEGTILSWSAGTVIFEPDNPDGHGAEQVAAGGTGWTGVITYIVWARGWGNLRVTTDPNVYGDPNQVVICTWYGGTGFHATYAQTKIHGDTITTRTINADRLQAYSITTVELSTGKLITTTAQIAEGLINRAHIGQAQIDDGHINSLSASKITAGMINAQYVDVGDRNDGRGFITIESRFGYRHMAYYDHAGIQRVMFGQQGPNPNRPFDGLYVRDVNGKEVLTANGLGVKVANENQLEGASTVNIHYFPGSPDFGFWAAPSTQGVQNRTLWTLRMVDIGPNGYPSGDRLWRVVVNGQEKFQWLNNEGFPPNCVIDVPAGVFVNVNLQLYARFADGSFAWVPYNQKLGDDPFWSVHQYPKTVWTVLEMKR